MRLRRRFVLALVVLTVVFSAVSLVGFTLHRNATVAQEEADVARVSQSIATQLDVILDEKAETVELWATTPALTDQGSRAQSRALRTFVDSTAFSGASVIHANGTMMAFHARGTNDSQSQALVGQQFGEREYFQRAVGGETYVSDPVTAESGHLIVTVSTPVYVEGRVAGTFNAAFHLDEGDLFGPLQARDSASEGIMVRANGSTVFADGPRPTADQTLAVANATVEQTGWTVSVTRSTAAVRPALRAITVSQIGTLALVVGALGVFGWWLYREYVANFERLQAGFSALADGEYGTRVTLGGSTEWTAVADDFNELSETLARRRVEVTVLNRVLRHNLRNAMTVIAGKADRIAEVADDQRLVEDAAVIRRRGDALLSLAEHARVVDSSLRIDRSESPPRPAGDVVADRVASLRTEFPDATIQVDRGPDAALVPDGDLVATAVTELVRNAVTHAAESVTVDVSATDSEVQITVADDGPGLPPVERRLLTEQFVETPTEHGSGLGLWVVKWIVQWLDGTISVSTDDGTRVTIRLPRVTDG